MFTAARAAAGECGLAGGQNTAMAMEKQRYGDLLARACAVGCGLMCLMVIGEMVCDA